MRGTEESDKVASGRHRQSRSRGKIGLDHPSLLHRLLLAIGLVSIPFPALGQTTTALPTGFNLSSIESFLKNIEPLDLATRMSPVLMIVGTLLIALSGLLFMLQARSFAGKMLALGIICVAVGAFGQPLLAPIIIFVKSLPIWLILLMAIFLLLALLGAFASIFIGREAASSMIGSLATDAVKGLFVLLIMPINAVRKMLAPDNNRD